MSRAIPGSIEVEGREFIYIEVTEGEGFREIIEQAMTSCKNVPKAKDGGSLEMKARLILEDGTPLLAISNKGDVEGWRKKLSSYCELTGRIWGIASKNTLSLSDGRKLILDQCNVVFEK